MLSCLVASVVTLGDPMDCNQSGSSVPRILLARILEWIAMPSSRGYLPDPGIETMFLMLPALQVDYLALSHKSLQI